MVYQRMVYQTSIKFSFIKLSKVLEEVVVTLFLHLQRNSLFEMFQSGFIAHQSTQTALKPSS